MTTSVCEQATPLSLESGGCWGRANNAKLKQRCFPAIIFTSTAAPVIPRIVALQNPMARHRSVYQVESHFPVSVIKIILSLRMFSKQSNFVFCQPELNTCAPNQILEDSLYILSKLTETFKPKMMMLCFIV